jgi:hypothetical protein
MQLRSRPELDGFDEFVRRKALRKVVGGFRQKSGDNDALRKIVTRKRFREVGASKRWKSDRSG